MSQKIAITMLCFSLSLSGCAETFTFSSSAPHQSTSPTHSSHHSDSILKDAFNSQTSDLQVQGMGEVTKLLPDDLEGSQHQRFILQLKSGQTLLIAHNIDLAPRISTLQIGDHVEFYGEYE